jgi:outer membrane usher protein
MTRPRLPRRAKHGLLALALLLPAAAHAGTVGGAQPQPVLLTVTLNGSETGDPQLLLQDPAGRLYAGLAALKLWRLRVPATPSLRYDGADYYLLDPHIFKLTFSAADQSLAIEAPPGSFDRQNRSLTADDEMPMTRSATGLFVNYDMFAEHASGATSLNGAFELGLFNAHGSASSTFVAQTGGSHAGVVRLDTNWIIDRPASMTSIRLGDGITGGGPGAPPLRFAGIQFARNFAVRPGFVTLALPSTSGSAALPSTVDVYVNNVLQGSRQVEPGPFDIGGIPLQSGGGTLRIVTRDLLGRETVTTQNYYAAADVLRRGLHDFSYEAGFLRRDYGIRSNDYGTFIAAATERFGLTDHVTLEGNFELTAHRQLAGAGVTMLAGSLGFISASATASRSERGTGGSLAIALERSVANFSIGVHNELATRNFAFVGMDRGLRAPKMTTEAFADLSFRYGSVGANYVRRDNRGKDDEQLAGIFASLDIGHFSTMQIFARRSVAGRSQTTFGIFLGIPLGGRRSASASVDHDLGGKTDANFSFQNDPPAGEGSGYRINATAGRTNHVDGQYSLNTSRASFTAQAGYGRGGAAVRLSMTGSIGLIRGQAFASRHIGSSFGAVQLAGLPDVRIYADNQLIGRTDGSGRLIIPALRAFERNVIRLDEIDIPLDIQLPETEIAVRPFARGATIVSFAPRRERGALLKIALEDGSALPAGAMVSAGGAGEGFVTASGGEVYIPNLAGTVRLRATWEQHSCQVDVTVPANDDPQPRIEGLICRNGDGYAHN